LRKTSDGRFAKRETRVGAIYFGKRTAIDIFLERHAGEKIERLETIRPSRAVARELVLV